MSQDNNTLRTGLIAINNNTVNGQSIETVNARELHEFIESKQQFADWIKDRIEQYDFTENQDFIVFHNSMKNPQGGRPLKDYALSLDMAKELSMVERTPKGKEARQYFIECEKIAKGVSQPAPKKVSRMQDNPQIMRFVDFYMKGSLEKVLRLKQSAISDIIQSILQLAKEQHFDFSYIDMRKTVVEYTKNEFLNHIIKDEPLEDTKSLTDRMSTEDYLAYAKNVKIEEEKKFREAKRAMQKQPVKLEHSSHQHILNDVKRSDHAIDTAVGIIAAQHISNANYGRAVMPAYYIANKQVIWTSETPKHATWIHALRALGRLVIDDTYMFHHINGLCATSVQNLQRVKTLSILDAFKFTDIEITKTDCNHIIDPTYIAPYGIRVNLTKKMEHLLSDYDSIKQWADDAVTCPGGMTTGESIFIPADVFLVACIYTEYSAPKDYNFYGKHHNKALS